MVQIKYGSNGNNKCRNTNRTGNKNGNGNHNNNNNSSNNGKTDMMLIVTTGTPSHAERC